MSLINSGDFIKHEKFLDVCIKVQHVFQSDRSLKILGTFWNTAYVNSFPIEERVIVDIALSQSGIDALRRTYLEEWEVLRDENAGPCLRKCLWEKVI